MSSIHHVLAIETSCDDTALAIVRHDGFVVSTVTANQDLVHRPFGGVVPEIASRNHTLQILPLLEELFKKSGWGWAQVDAIAVTNRPGLIGSLLVGVVTAKTLALVNQKPFIGVNHLEAHLLAPFLHDEKSPKPADFDFAYLALAVSGGHTQLYHVRALRDYLVLGRTVDDAAGEAFDKFAKALGLGFPGGAALDKLASGGDPKKFRFPRTMKDSNDLNFSFSGLKAAGVRLLETLTPEQIEAQKADLAASYQEAVVDSLMIKLKAAQKSLAIRRVVISGGVCANSRLRAVAEEWARFNGIHLVMPPLRYCTDNAAMVGLAGIWRLRQNEGMVGATIDAVSDQKMAPSASSWPEDFKEMATNRD